MLAQLVRHRHRINTRKDQSYMEKYLTEVSRAGSDKPDIL